MKFVKIQLYKPKLFWHVPLDRRGFNCTVKVQQTLAFNVNWDLWSQSCQGFCNIFKLKMIRLLQHKHPRKWQCLYLLSKLSICRMMDSILFETRVMPLPRLMGCSSCLTEIITDILSPWHWVNTHTNTPKQQTMKHLFYWLWAKAVLDINFK